MTTTPPTATSKALGGIFDRDTLNSLHDRLGRAARTQTGPARTRAEAARQAIAAILDHDLPTEDPDEPPEDDTPEGHDDDENEDN